MKPQIHLIFPTPIFQSDLDRPLTKEELNFINKIKQKTYINVGNKTSLNNKILNHKPFKKIKNQIDMALKQYLDFILKPKNDFKLYTTQSWLNTTNDSEYHHVHFHANSILSGVLYLQANPEVDSITFHKPKSDFFEISPAKYEVYNSEKWTFPVNTGLLFIFPSPLYHSVSTKKGDNERISLAFNTFFKGKIGTEKDLTELII
tara:strand:- start:163 stop:774 length:612 start_codon:yes stop_codon:yes gene_type:complete